jgi:hypothetical protein
MSAADLVAAINGDLSALERLRSVDHEELVRASDRVALPRVTRRIAHTLLSSYLQGAATSEDLELWAFLVRWGVIRTWRDQSRRTPAHLIRVEYVSEDDDVLADTIARMDEIENEGEISPGEARQLLARLALTPDESQSDGHSLDTRR